MSTVSEWMVIATRPEVVKRAARTAAFVGFLLITINHGEKILSHQVTGYNLLQICLTVAVPYLVSTSSSVATLREMQGKAEEKPTKRAAHV